MSLFIHAENQKLLWETINKSPLLLQHPKFNTNPNQKSEWFREIVKQVYYSIPAYETRNLTRDELQQYNRSAIKTMLASLNGGGGVGGPPASAYPNNPVGQPARPVSILKEPVTEFSRNMVKKNEFQEQFSNRQKEYETMFQKPLPKEINFSEDLDDGVITNMEELIQKQKRQREMEISQQFTVGIAPPELPVPPQAAILPTPPPTHANPRQSQLQTPSQYVQPIQQNPLPQQPPQRLQIADEILEPERIIDITQDLAQPQEITLLDKWKESVMIEMEKMRKQIEVLQEQLAMVPVQIKKLDEKDADADEKDMGDKTGIITDVMNDMIEQVITL
jgi:hypothetical protein